MAELIQALEYAFSDVVYNARAAIRGGEEELIQYMGLLELFPIGQLVTTHAVGALGPAVDVVLRVHDAFYDPYR